MKVGAFTVAGGARVVAMSPTIAAKVEARASCNNASTEDVLVDAVRKHICSKWPDKKIVLNARKLILAAMNGEGEERERRIGEFEWVDGGMIAVVTPMIARTLDIMAIQRCDGKSWLDEFAFAVRLGSFSNYELMALQAQREVMAFYQGGPKTAVVMEMLSGIEPAPPPPQPEVPPYDRDRFHDFVEIGTNGQIIQPWEVPAWARDMATVGLPMTDAGRHEYLRRYHPHGGRIKNISDATYHEAYVARHSALC